MGRKRSASEARNGGPPKEKNEKPAAKPEAGAQKSRKDRKEELVRIAFFAPSVVSDQSY